MFAISITSMINMINITSITNIVIAYVFITNTISITMTITRIIFISIIGISIVQL